MKTAWIVEASSGPDEPPKIYWSGGGSKGAFLNGRSQVYDATLSIQMIPKTGREGGYKWTAFYDHRPSADALAHGAQGERHFVLDEGECRGRGDWGGEDWAGPIWKDLGATFLWSAARDAIGPFDWPDWVKGHPEDLPFYKRWDG